MAVGIDRLKHAMKKGHIFVMSALEPMVERLYDVLNNRPVELGAMKYFRIATDRKFEICEAHDQFRFDSLTSGSPINKTTIVLTQTSRS
jgi:hypothetical protein